jgi:hypothetical protein
MEEDIVITLGAPQAVTTAAPLLNPNIRADPCTRDARHQAETRQLQTTHSSRYDLEIEKPYRSAVIGKILGSSHVTQQHPAGGASGVLGHVGVAGVEASPVCDTHSVSAEQSQGETAPSV